MCLPDFSCSDVAAAETSCQQLTYLRARILWRQTTPTEISKLSLPKHWIVGSAASKVSKAFGDMLALVLGRQQDMVTKVA